MTTSKLVKKLFKLKVKGKVGDDNTSASSLAALSTPASKTIPAQQHPQHQQSRTQKASPFLSLPGEIRNQIYSHAIFPSLSTITIFHHANPVLSPPIFHICHQIRDEAISHLCASKIIYLSGLGVVNEFFEIIGDGVRSLRHVVVRCVDAWCAKSETVDVERNELLDHLELATGLKRLDFIVGRYPLSERDEWSLKDARSVGARFMFAIRDIVDDEGQDDEGLDLNERFGRLCDELGREHAVRYLREALIREHEEREKKVFRLCKVTGIEGKVAELKLPCRSPEFLRRPEEGRRTECMDGRNDEQGL